MKATINGIEYECISTRELKKRGYTKQMPNKTWRQKEDGIGLAHKNTILKAWIVYA